MERPNIKPHHLVIGLGAAIALFTATSGVVPLITEWHDDSHVQRHVFGNIPSAVKLAFYIVIPLVIVYGAVMFAMRVKNWERGTPDNRRTTPRTPSVAHGGLPFRRLHADPAARSRRRDHAQPDLLLVPDPARRHHDPRDQPPAARGLKFLHGTTYQAYSFVGDLAGLAFLVGVVWAIVRRYVQRPYRIRIKSKPSTPHPRHPAAIGGHRASWPRPGASPGGHPRLREVVVHRLPDRHRWSTACPRSAAGHQIWWMAHVSPSSCSW
jgi:hypothetical protein